MGLHGLDPNGLPQPIAHAYLRLTHETSPHGIITRSFKLLEAGLMHTVWTAVSLYLELPEGDASPEVERRLRALHRPVLGQWVGALLALDKTLVGNPEWWVDLDRQTPRPDPDSTRSAAARQVVNELVALRNRATHQTLGLSGVGRLADAIQDALDGVLRAFGITTLAPPFVVESCEAGMDASAVRRRAAAETLFNVHVTPIAGTGMQLRQALTVREPLRKGWVYQAIPSGRYLLLHPFVQRLPQTGRCAVANGISGHSMSLVDADSGDQHAVQLSEEEVRDLAPLLDGAGPPGEPEAGAAGPPEPPSRGEACPLPPLTTVSSPTGPPVAAPALPPPSASVSAGPPGGRGLPTVLAGRYRILECLGTGGSGSVYRATHEVTGQVSAVKLLNVEASQDPRWRGRFEREARTLARLEHPGIVQLRDFGEADGRLFLVMEFCPGGSLAQRIATRGAMPADEAGGWLCAVAESLQHAHSQSVVHRDLKPANLLFSAQGEIKVGDFGLAYLQGTETQSTAGLVVGTPHYMAPEQILGEPVDVRTDVYALGAILHEVLTGHPPYEGGSAFAVQEQHLKAPLPCLRCHLPGVSMELEKVVSRAMAKRPEARQPDAATFATDLRAALGFRSAVASTLFAGRGDGPGGYGPVVRPSGISPVADAQRAALGASSLRERPASAAGFEFCRNQSDSFQRLTALHYRATSHIKATRFSDRAIQDRSHYWQAVVDRAHDPEITYYRLMSVQSRDSLHSVLSIVDQLKTARNFRLALTRSSHPFEIILRDGDEVVFCFHKGDFVVYAGLAFDGEENPGSQRVVALFESMFDEMWEAAEMHVNFRNEVGGDGVRAETVKREIRSCFRDFDDS